MKEYMVEVVMFECEEAGVESKKDMKIFQITTPKKLSHATAEYDSMRHTASKLKMDLKLEELESGQRYLKLQLIGRDETTKEILEWFYFRPETRE